MLLSLTVQGSVASKIIVLMFLLSVSLRQQLRSNARMYADSSHLTSSPDICCLVARLCFSIMEHFLAFLMLRELSRDLFLQDLYLEHQLDDKVNFKWEFDELNRDDEGYISERCRSCYQNSACFNPLHWSTFQVEEEFISDIPLEVQMLLMTFIQKDSLWKCHDPSDFVQAKVVRLYALYNALLNIANRNHFGILQR